MKNTLNHYIRNFQDKHKSIRRYLAVFLVLAAGIFLVVRTTVGGDATSEGFVVDFNGKGLLPEQKKEDNE